MSDPTLPSPSFPDPVPVAKPFDTTVSKSSKPKRHMLRKTLVIGGTFVAGVLVGTLGNTPENDAVATQEATSPASEATEAPEATPVVTEALEATQAVTTPSTEAPECQPGEVRGVGQSRQSCSDSHWVFDPEATPTTTVAPALPLSPSDFVVSLFVTENECYNTAGALITAEPDLTYLGTQDLTGREFTIVFDVTGGGLAQTGSVELLADGQYSYNEEMYSTDTCVDSLQATVTAVRER